MIYIKIITVIIGTLIISSCSQKIFTYDKECLNTSLEINKRNSLFPNISQEEIEKRKNTKIPAISKPEEISTLSIITNAIKNAPKDSKFILVDLRFYQDVDLTNIIISNESDFALTPYLYTSKYSQGYYSLININKKSITVSPPEKLKIFKPYKLYRPDLANSEIIINLSGSQEIFGNMKFSNNILTSIIADNIAKPFRLDLREASEMQFNLNKKWIMPIYSVENSKIENSKISTSKIEYINNNGASINLKSFKKSAVKCYADNQNIIQPTK